MKPHLWFRNGDWHCAQFLWFGPSRKDGYGLTSKVGTQQTAKGAFLDWRLSNAAWDPKRGQFKCPICNEGYLEYEIRQDTNICKGCGYKEPC